MLFVSSVDYVLSVLNNFDPRIQLTYELEHSGILNFLNVLLIRNLQQLEIELYRKQTNTDKYIPSNSFPPLQWKRSTLSTIVHRTNTICPNQRYLDEKRHQIRQMLH